MVDPQPSTDPVARACALFDEGVSCAPAVFAAFAPRLGLSEDLAARSACCFGGGMIGSGKTCGAVTGAMMALGLAYGAGAQMDLPRKQAAYARTAELWKRFADRQGSIACKDILGLDLSTPEGRTQAAASGVFKTKCAGVVRDAAQILAELL
jgi:C_GCAxxG_C_C family probable redox protein